MSLILLVEDSKVLAAVMQRTLEDARHTVVHATSLEDAVRIAYQQHPELVITVQHRSDEIALDVCRRVKSDVTLSAIPVLMLSSSVVEERHVQVLEAGADAFLPQTCSENELLAVIERLLKNSVRITSLNDASTPQTARHPTRILVVDDSPTFLTLIRRSLSGAGFDVTGASTGAKAMSLLKQQPFDVAVTDVLMPGMDGFEFAAAARQWALENNRQLGLLVLTGQTNRDILVRSLDAGADDYVNKSSDMSLIVAHTTALARRIARTQQITSINAAALRKEMELREVELKRQQAEERARLADELARTNRALAESNAQLKQFAYVASHDLQAPLRRVVALCALLQEESEAQLSDDSQGFLHNIVKCTSGMQRLINDLLAYSEVNSSKPPKVTVDCNAVVDEVIGNLADVIADTGATIARDNLPTVRAHRTQLVRLFQNLISNAIHYRSEAPPRIHVLVDDRRAGQWTFQVSDNGIGIEKEYHDQVFMMFKRLHGSERAGSGIGLATCEKIVERHGGEIWIESQPGEGSTFLFTIPTASTSEATSAAISPEPHQRMNRDPIGDDSSTRRASLEPS